MSAAGLDLRGAALVGGGELHRPAPAECAHGVDRDEHECRECAEAVARTTAAPAKPKRQRVTDQQRQAHARGYAEGLQAGRDLQAQELPRARAEGYAAGFEAGQEITSGGGVIVFAAGALAGAALAGVVSWIASVIP